MPIRLLISMIIILVNQQMMQSSGFDHNHESNSNHHSYPYNESSNFSSEYILSKEDKIQILSELLEQMLPETPLKVNQTFCGILEDNGSSSHTYQILGTLQKRKTQNTNLQYKLKQAEENLSFLPTENEANNNHRKHHNNPQNTNEGEQQNDNDLDDDQKDEPTQNRYFKPNIRCFRCKLFGHYSSHCPDDSVFCLHCLSEQHTTENCPQKTVCFRCYEFGHIANACRAGEGVFCRVCSRKHRDQCGFLARGYDNSKSIIVRDTEEMEDVVCLHCRKIGHVNCEFEGGN